MEVWAEGLLVDAAQVLRRLHDANLGFDRAGAAWKQPVRRPDQVVSVEALMPYNLVVEGAG
jgi:hypothetical protein